MRKVLILLCLAMTTNFMGQALNTISLEEGISRKVVTLEAIGNPESTHYQQPILLELKNISESSISIEVANGLIFHADTEDVQDLIITQKELIALNAGEEKSIPLNAMCIESSNSASNEHTRYTIGTRAQGDLAALCRKIEKDGFHDSVGQHAIWALIDGTDVNEIIGFDEAKAHELKTYVAEIQGIPVPAYRPEQLESYRRSNNVNRSTKGYFDYTFAEPRAITIALFDSENRLIREIYNNPLEAPEQHRVEFAFDMEMDRTQTYYVHLLADGKIEMTLTMKGRNG